MCGVGSASVERFCCCSRGLLGAWSGGDAASGTPGSMQQFHGCRRDMGIGRGRQWSSARIHDDAELFCTAGGLRKDGDSARVPTASRPTSFTPKPPPGGVVGSIPMTSTARFATRATTSALGRDVPRLCAVCLWGSFFFFRFPFLHRLLGTHE